MKDPSQRVKTDDIDSFFGGLPLAGCPLGAPTLHITDSHRDQRPLKIFQNRVWTRASPVGQLDPVLPLAICAQWLNVDLIRRGGGERAVLIIIWSAP